MTYRTLGALALFLTVGGLSLMAQDPPPAPPQIEVKTLSQRAGYAVGWDLGQKMKQSGADLDVDTLARGIRDALAGREAAITPEAMNQAMQELQQQVETQQKAKMTEMAGKQKAEGQAFLEKNKTAEGVKVTPSGLQYKVVKAGNGQKPAATDTVTVHYEGKLIDGTVFDSSYQRQQPATFPLNRVIKGWTEGLQLMDVGSEYMLYIPSDLAYGETPRPGGPIPPNAVLVFKVELLEISK